ncbi:MAG: hypothetical protein U1E28_05165 [Beijerinckiaceae bacterium]
MSRDKASAGGRQERLAAALRDNLRRRKQAHRPAQDDASGKAAGAAISDPLRTELEEADGEKRDETGKDGARA